MEDGNYEGTDDTDELLCTDAAGESGSTLSLGPTAFCRDHCDLLLDAIDDQLSRLQVRGVATQTTRSDGRTHGGNVSVLRSVHLDRSKSVSKDTGLGTTNPPTDKAASTPDTLNSDPSDKSTGTEATRMEPGWQQEGSNEHVGLFTATSWQTVGTAGPGGTRREQCLWRLERLLGTNPQQVSKVTGREEEEESVCTEDFSSRFRDVMLEVTEPCANEAATDILSSYTALTEAQKTVHLNTVHEPRGWASRIPIRHLAEVPLQSVTTDSDLDSVDTEQLQWQIQRTLNNKTVHDLLHWSGSGTGRHSLTHTQQREDQTVSSDDDEEVKGECVRHCRKLRAPTSLQRRKKTPRSQRTISTPAPPSTPSTAGKAKQDGKLTVGCSDTESSLLELHQQKATAVRMVERLKLELEQAERERHTLHVSLTHCREHSQLLRSELHKLQAQRNICVKEDRALEESQATLQKHTNTCNHDTSSQTTTRYYDATSHTTGCYDDDSHHRCVSSRCVSALEREEMDRLVDNAKSELFSEQRRFRHTLESLQEKLEEVTQDLEQKEEVNRKLRERCSHLEEKLAVAGKQREELHEIERAEQEGRMGALEKMVTQKEMLLLDMQEEKKSLEKKIRAIQEEHSATLTAELTLVQKQKELDVEQLTSQWTLAHEHKIQLVCRQAHEQKAAALRDQALAHTRNTESLRNHVQLKEQEVIRLQESLDEQQETLRRQEEELKRETREQVDRAVLQEQRKWERWRAESLREQRGRWEERVQEVERTGRAEVERERRSALTLQNKSLELQRRVEELEREASAQTAALVSLRDEQQTELETLRDHLQQNAESQAMLLKQCVKQSEQEILDLKAALAKSERVHKGAAARQDQQNRSWAQDVRVECAWIQELLTANGMPADTKPLSRSGTVSEALQMLQSLRKPLQHLITSLQNNITSLTHTTQQLSTGKELELRVQREHLAAEKEDALNFLKQKLIQEHIEELSCVSRLRLREDDDDGLRKQLMAKEEDLSQVHRSMAQWKEETTTRLVRTSEEQLSSELERRTSRPRSEQSWRLEKLEGEGHPNRDCSNHADVNLNSTPPASVLATPTSHNLTSYKLLRHLQSRIRQLQADSQTQTPSPAHLTQGRRAADLGGSYLEMIAPAQETCASHPSARTAPC